jgi:predicted esterase
VRILTIETTTHGRVLIDDAFSGEAGWVVGFHGYGQNADDTLNDLRRIPGIDRWRIASVQALSRFYTRDEGVVASWMTRQDRELAIADNLVYVDKAIDALDLAPKLRASKAPRLVLVGFSQGAAMAFRAGFLGRHHPDGVIALGGDVPPEVTTSLPRRSSERAKAGPQVLLGAGKNDRWYTAEKVDKDEAFLRASGIDHQIVRFDGGHEWNDEFRRAVGDWLS